MNTTMALNKEKKDKKRGALIAFFIHAALFGLALFPFLVNYATPEPEEAQFVVLEFDDFNSAAKKSSTKKAVETKPKAVKTPKKPTPKKPKKAKPVPTAPKKPVKTDVREDTPIKTKPIESEKEVEAPMEDAKPQVPEPVAETEEEVVEEASEEATPTPADKAGDKAADGEGKQGDSDSGDAKTDGVADKGDDGLDFSGDGIFNRRVIFRADVKRITKKEGKIVINLCVNRDGRVIYAKANGDESTIKDNSVIRKAIKLTTEYKFERDYTAPKKQCGKMTYIFEIDN